MKNTVSCLECDFSITVRTLKDTMLAVVVMMAHGETRHMDEEKDVEAYIREENSI